MSKQLKDGTRRVLIASANPLFGEGLRNLLRERWGARASVVGLTSTMAQTLDAFEKQQPDLVILDYDDRTINREEFLSRFVSGERPMQVMLVSLKATGAVVVYDRRSLTPSEAEDWLDVYGRTRKRKPRAPGGK
jgi:cytochrome c oxidase subunit 2